MYHLYAPPPLPAPMPVQRDNACRARPAAAARCIPTTGAAPRKSHAAAERPQWGPRPPAATAAATAASRRRRRPPSAAVRGLLLSTSNPRIQVLPPSPDSLEPVPQDQEQRQALALLVRARGGLGRLRRHTHAACTTTTPHETLLQPAGTASTGRVQRSRRHPAQPAATHTTRLPPKQPAPRPGGCLAPAAAPAALALPCHHRRSLPHRRHREPPSQPRLGSLAAHATTPPSTGAVPCCGPGRLHRAWRLPRAAGPSPAPQARLPAAPRTRRCTYEDAAQLVKHPVPGGIEPLHVLLRPANHFCTSLCGRLRRQSATTKLEEGRASPGAPALVAPGPASADCTGGDTLVLFVAAAFWSLSRPKV